MLFHNNFKIINKSLRVSNIQTDACNSTLNSKHNTLSEAFIALHTKRSFKAKRS